MSDKAVQEEQDFTATMQQLSAEAEKTLPAMPIVEDTFEPPASADQETATVTELIHGLENTILSRLEKFCQGLR